MAKCLVVDDELFYREFVADVLKKAGHEVVPAKDGKEALNLFSSRADYDVVLTDVVMPGLDGLGVLAKIRKKDDSIPIIMLSAHEDQRMVINALRRGAFDYQRKPLSPHELSLAVDRAMEHRKLQRDKSKKLERLASLENGARKLSEMVVGQIPLEAVAKEYDLLENTVKLVADILECDRVSIMVLDEKEQCLKVAVSVGMSKTLIKSEKKPVQKSPSAYVLETGEAILVEDVEGDERVDANQYASQYKTDSFVIAPIKVGDKIIGTINANDKKDKSSFDQDDLIILRTISYHVSAAISHAIHHSSLEKERERLTRLIELQRILINYLEPEEMMRGILRKCQEMLDAASTAVFLKDEFSEDLTLKVGFNGSKEIKKEIVIPAGESITGIAGRQGETLIENDPQNNHGFIAQTEWPGKGVIKNILACPIRLSNTTIGVIRLLNKKEDEFNSEDAGLIQDVADSMALAIRNLKLYEQLNNSVEEIITANRNLQAKNDELNLKAKELAALKKYLASQKKNQESSNASKSKSV
ncbi:MAG: GAF domain-containing protein [bacterium]